MSQAGETTRAISFKPLQRAQSQLNTLVRPSTTFFQDAWFRLRHHQRGMVGLAIVALMLLLAIFGPTLTHISYSDQNLSQTYQAPSGAHIMGTDNLGRDVYVRLLYGARISLSVGFVATLISLGIGVVYGTISGYYGGRSDEIMMRLVEVLMSVPDLLYVILLTTVIKPGLIPIYIVLGAVGWLTMARLVRGEVLSLKEREYVLAARITGARPSRILFRHLIPNAMGPILVAVTIGIPSAIFLESFLSFIGLGVSAPMASWGSMASEGITALQSHPHLLFFPAAAISLTMLGFNFLGDGLRDAFDPRMRR
ncbi:MAG: ABC transporter permease [Symbiobacteriia bacterium]